MARKLTALAVENAKPKRNAAGQPARTEYPDAGCPGLYLVVQPSKVKSYALRYRRPGGRPAKFTLGAAATAQGDGGLTLAAARAAAAAARHDIARGIDPAASRRTVKAAAPTAEDNVEVQAERFLDLHARRKLRPATLRQYESVLARLVLPKWRGRSGGHQTPRRHRPGRGHRRRPPDHGQPRPGRDLEALRWLLARDVVAASPAHGVEMPGKENARERALDDGEVAALWLACEGEGVAGAAVRVMLATGARRSEVSGMRWDEIDPEPAVDDSERGSKSKRALAVPLSTLAWKVIDDLPRLGPFVFSIDGCRPVKNFIRIKDKLDAKLKFSEPFVLARSKTVVRQRFAATRRPR